MTCCVGHEFYSSTPFSNTIHSIACRVTGGDYRMSKPNYLVSEEQVKRAMHIDSFRNLSKDKVMEFVNLIPQMDKEVAITIINQFPAYTDFAKDMVGQLYSICVKAIESSDASRRDAVMAYMKVLDTLSEELKVGDLSEAERKDINEKMILVADKVAGLDTKHKRFLENITRYAPAVATAALAIGAAILGVNVRSRQRPQIPNQDAGIKNSSGDA